MRCARDLVAIGCLLAFAEPAPAQNNGASAELRALRGIVVVDDASAAPLRRARVTVEWPGGRSGPVFTDDQGRFEVPVPASQQHTITAAKAGYAPRRVRERVAPDGPLDVRLPRGAVLTGTVVDQAGAPVAGMDVQVRQVTDQSGAAVTSPAITSNTDDRGEFRAGSLPAGRYAVAIVPSAFIPLASQGTQGPAGVRLKYQGTADLAEESPVQLRAGEQSFVNLVMEAELRDAVRRASSYAAGYNAGADAARAGRSEPAPAGRTGSILGRVIEPGGRPQAGATVRATSADGSVRMGSTDADGHYEIRGLPAGAIRIVASRSGFVQTAYGAQVPGRAGQTVSIRAGDRVTGLDVALVPGSVIAGVVVDEFGEPLEGLTVHVWRSQWQSGRHIVVPVDDVARRVTDDRGQYRLYGVLPGSYYVTVNSKPPEDFSVAGSLTGDALVVDQVLLERGRQVFYPGRASLTEAVPLAIAAGQDAFGVDVTFVPGSSGRIHGRVVDESGQPYRGVVTLSVSARSGAPLLAPRRTPAAGGDFEFDDVPPGDYVVQALPWSNGIGPRVEAGPDDIRARGAVVMAGLAAFGMAFVTLRDGDSDAGPIAIRMAPGSSIRARVSVEGDASPASGLTLQAVASDLDAAPRDGPRPAALLAGGKTFEMTNLTGPTRFVLSGPAGWWLKAVTIDGVNAADDPVMFGTPDRSRDDVEVVLSNRGGEVTGRVAGTGSQAVGGAMAIVFATDPARWYERSRYVKSARAGQEGRFSVTGLPPGEYWVAALDVSLDDRLDAGEWQNPDVLSALSSSARRVTLGEGGRAAVELRIP